MSLPEKPLPEVAAPFKRSSLAEYRVLGETLREGRPADRRLLRA